MSRIVNPYKCDVCGMPKGDGNKWLLGLVVAKVDGQPGGRIGFGEVGSLLGYAIISWSDELANRDDKFIHHLCSDKCALTKQAEYLRRPA